MLYTVLIVTAIEGFTMMVYEILWTRTILEFSYDKSSYVYTVVILGFLFGLSSGAFIVRKHIDKWKDLLLKFSYVEYGSGFIALFAFILFSYLTPIFYHSRFSNDTWFNVSGREYIYFFITTSLPAFLMGISYPLAGKIITDNFGRLGSRMGLLSFTDTIGSVAGPVIAGFVMLRIMNVYHSYMLCVVLNLASGIALLLVNRNISLSLKRILPAAAVLIPALTVLFIFPLSAYNSNKAKLYEGETILDVKEGMTATVLVTQLPSGYRALTINGAKTAFTNPEDQRVHKMLAYLPWFYNPQAKNAAVIGFGLGITARCLTDLNIETSLAELSPEVLFLSSKNLNYVNHGVLGGDHIKTYVEDGRSMLLRSREKFDIITTNAVHPRLGANLYSSDFYRLCNDRLTDSGTICQWIPTNWMTEDEFRSMVRSFIDVFPWARLWYANRAHTLIVGSRTKYETSYEQFKELFYRQDIYYELIDVDLVEPESILSGFFLTENELRNWAGNIAPDTDDRPIIEYSFVTDPRPNQNILRTLIASKPDFERCIQLPDTIDQDVKDYVFGRINADYEQHISYLKGLSLTLAAQDSLKF